MRFGQGLYDHNARSHVYSIDFMKRANLVIEKCLVQIEIKTVEGHMLIAA
jgi:hypothetical protein